jgi:hypothetical protein
VALNRAGEPGAVKLPQAKAKLALPDGVDVLPLDARDAASCRQVLRALVDAVLKAGPGPGGAA